MENIFFSYHFNRLFGSPYQFCLNVNIGIIRRYVFILDVNILPGQTKNFPSHPERTRKSKVHSNIPFAVSTLVQSDTDGIGVPDVTFLVLCFRQYGSIKGIFCNQLPADSLLKGTAEKFDDLWRMFWLEMNFCFRFWVPLTTGGSFGKSECICLPHGE